MSEMYTREQLLMFSNEGILKLTNGKAVNFHLIDGRCTQLCVNDLAGFDSKSGCFQTKTGIKICLQEIYSIELKG